jgi:phage gpG-like protein
VVGTKMPYARYHERGFSASFGKVGKRGVPRRKLVGIAKHDRQSALAMIENYLVRGVA